MSNQFYTVITSQEVLGYSNIFFLNCELEYTTSYFGNLQIYWVGDAIQPSHPLLSPSPPALNLSQHQGLFQWVGSLHQAAKALERQLQHQPSQWIFRAGMAGLFSPQSRELSRVLSSAAVQKHQFFGALHSSWSNSHIHTWQLGKPQLWLYRPLLANTKGLLTAIPFTQYILCGLARKKLQGTLKAKNSEETEQTSETRLIWQRWRNY